MRIGCWISDVCSSDLWSPGPARAELARNLPRKIERGGNPRNNTRGCNGQKQSRHLRHQRIANREQDIGLCRIAQRKAVAARTQNDAAKNIYDQNQYARNGSISEERRGRKECGSTCGYRWMTVN